MRLQVKLRNMADYSHLKKFVHSETQECIGKFERGREFQAEVSVRSIQTRPGARPWAYECQLLFVGDQLSGNLFVRKSGPNFHSAVRRCLDSAEKKLRRESSTRTVRRRRNLRRHEQVNWGRTL